MRILSSTQLSITMAAILLNFSAIAQTQPHAIKQTMTVFDNQITIPMSAWQEAAFHAHQAANSQSDLFNTYKQQKNRTFVFEQIPSGETFEQWTKLTALTAIFHPDQKKITPEHVAYNNKLTFQKACTFYQYLEIPVHTKTSQGLIVTIFCEQIKNTHEGEIMVKFITTTPNYTTVQIYSEWKGATFDALDEATWPVSWATLQDQIKRYQKINITTKE